MNSSTLYSHTGGFGTLPTLSTVGVQVQPPCCALTLQVVCACQEAAQLQYRLDHQSPLLHIQGTASLLDHQTRAWCANNAQSRRDECQGPHTSPSRSTPSAPQDLAKHVRSKQLLLCCLSSSPVRAANHDACTRCCCCMAMAALLLHSRNAMQGKHLPTYRTSTLRDTTHATCPCPLQSHHVIQHKRDAAVHKAPQTPH